MTSKTTRQPKEGLLLPQLAPTPVLSRGGEEGDQRSTGDARPTGLSYDAAGSILGGGVFRWTRTNVHPSSFS